MVNNIIIRAMIMSSLIIRNLSFNISILMHARSLATISILYGVLYL